jgi:glycosyltransferase involved in cell wall biosynthesis
VPPSGVVAYFGYPYRAKGLHQLFAIANPKDHHLLLVTDLSFAEDDYGTEIMRRASAPEWAGRVTITGFLPDTGVARALAAADAVVLPFLAGGGPWNTSLLAALDQRTFVLTTSRDRRGYDADSNAYYAKPSDIAEMATALKRHIGVRGGDARPPAAAHWETLAEAHYSLYREICDE